MSRKKPTIPIMGEAKSFTPDEIKYIIEQWTKGVTAKAIGSTLGRTKNSVIGRVRRLSEAGMITRRDNPVKDKDGKPLKTYDHEARMAKAGRTPRPRRIKPALMPPPEIPYKRGPVVFGPPPPPVEIEPMAPPPPPPTPPDEIFPLSGVNLPDVTRWHRGCQWIMAKGKTLPRWREVKMCDAPRVSGQSYCSKHCKMAFTTNRQENPLVKMALDKVSA